MKIDSKLANAIENGDFILTAEYLPVAGTDSSGIESAAKVLDDSVLAVNVADNHYGVAMSSLAASVAMLKSDVEPVYQIVTRDRNRIALQSDLLGAAYLGIKNVLCLSGYHQTLTGSPESANVYDIDSIQLVAAVRKLRDEGVLLDGTKIEGGFSMLIGAAANPYLTPIELNIIRLNKKVEAGADFIQTQAVFDIEAFGQWLDAAVSEGVTEKIAILAGIMPLESAAEAEKLRETYTDLYISDELLERLKAAGDEQAQKKEGLAISAETIKKVKDMNGVRGIHILSGGKEAVVPELLAVSGL
ncbi:MAG TPA: 5,10-methylenetetrahydrofolate reductase [Phycisphaerales bacterium]|nr:5,10-methylenetetrahydrofolate reductase [Phycisphaerales bacterium]